MDWDDSGSSPHHTNDLKGVLTDPQSVLVTMILSKGKALTIKRHNGPPDKSGIIQIADYLVRYKGITDLHKCLAFEISYMSSHSNLTTLE